ncbi:guanitoxin biosynthesis heme-dependent pre-guanitoxin N-hydroxylase GntA [Micromonospora sp. NPDC000663]|uniref:guanitoxin biosynthesis heme-dependent pre-guanitoxin N-hydroxylase GntA n=1 Tax=Micromonospora sp. NPDC000663 TaxID=3364218 RepID=UPI0036BACD36
MSDITRFQARDIRQELENWIVSEDFSCLGARASVRRKSLFHAELPPLGAPDTAAPLHAAIESFVKDQLRDTEDFATLVAVFAGPDDLSEQSFETLLWRQLSDLHTVDSTRFDWTPEVERDPASPYFGFSVAGHPFFLVGMHSNASRASRRFPLPAIAFNSHRQFRRLRSTGTYGRLQARIRDREQRLQGSINPNLADPGEDSEAKQYSGRATSPDWQCPFRSAP